MKKHKLFVVFLIVWVISLISFASLTAQEAPPIADSNSDMMPQASYNMDFISAIGTGTWSGWDVAVQGNFAYVADTKAGLRIVNISNPANPVQISTFSIPSSAYFVSVSGNYAYLTGDKLHIINIADPYNPYEVGNYNKYASSAVVIRNNLAYMTTYGGMSILNVSNPSSPQLVGSLTINGTVYGIDVVGNYAYLADGGPFDSYCGLRVVNISNPASPTLLGSSPHLQGTICEGVAVQGDYAYVTTWDAGIYSINVANPANPTIATHFNTNLTRGITIANDDYAYVAGSRNFVFDASALPALDTVGYYDYSDGHGRDLAVSGDYIYVIKQSAELTIFRYEIPKPTMSINYSTGAPGSYFTLVGENFPENSSATVSVNGNVLGSTPVDSIGKFTFLLSTSVADEGAYFVTASVNPSATQQFVLNVTEPNRGQEDSGDIFNVPSGIAFNQFVYLPVILR